MAKAHPVPQANLYLGILFGLLVAASIYFHISNTHTTTVNYLFNGATAYLYFAAGFIALRRRSSMNRPTTDPASRALFYFGCSAMAWALASLVWTFYNLGSDIDVPYPSLADGFFILFYPTLGLALWNLFKVYQTQVNAKAVVESMFILIISAIAVFLFLRQPDVSAEQGLLANLLDVAYTLCDVFLVSMAFIALRSGQTKKHYALYLLITFLLLQAAGDFVFTQRNNNDVYFNGDISDVLFAASGFVFALALCQKDLLKPVSKNNDI